MSTAVGAEPMGAATPGWEHFAHDADVGVRGHGQTLAQAFEQAALALTAVITDPHSVRPRQVVEVACTAGDRELLLVDWLNAVIYESVTRGMLFSEFAVSLDGNALRGRMTGEALDPARHQPAVEPKGATLTALSVAQAGDGTWTAQCVVDV